MIEAILKLESNFMLTRRSILMVLVLVVAFDVNHAAAQSSRHMTGQIAVDWEMVAKIREEGLQRSGISNTLSYMTDVLGARLTNSRDMKHAQSWVIEEMKQMGLVNVVSEPFMEYGASWDNEYFSLHLLKPDYQPMVGYPIAHTPGTGGKRELEVVIADIRTRQDIEKYKGKLRGLAVLSSPPPAVDLERFAKGTPRRTDDDLRALFQRHKQRFTHNIPEALETFLGPDPGKGPCNCRMVRVFNGPRLLAASFFDMGDGAASSVYGLFEPEDARRSLGIFTMLLEIQHCRESGLRWLYPGYATHEPSVYDYKKQFRGTEFLDWSTGEWLPLP